MRLPERLEAIVRQVVPGGVVADVGTGHGLLPLTLIQRGIAHRVIATERGPEPLAEAERLLADDGDGRIALREGWGLRPLRPGEVTTLVLAGMGGETICAILAADPETAGSARQLVLQPQNHPGQVRRWLLTHGFALVAEDLVAERGHFYPLVGAVPVGGGNREETEPGAGTTKTAGTTLRPVSPVVEVEAQLASFTRQHRLPPLPASALLEAGPLLLAERHPLLGAQLQRRAAGARELIGRLERLGTPRTTRRVRAIQEELRSLEMMEEWLSRSAPS